MNRILRLTAVVCLIIFLGACRLFDSTPPGGLPDTGLTPSSDRMEPPAPTQAVVIVEMVTATVPPVEPVNTEAAVPTPAATDTGASGTSATLPAGIVLLERGVHEESADPRYQIDVVWPELGWDGDERVRAFNELASSIASTEIDTFKQGVAQTPNDPAFKEFASSLQVSYTPTYQQDGLFSVKVNISFYMAGAAHPAHYSRAINYDLREGKVLELADLFQPGMSYLNTLSRLSLEDLNARGVLAWEDGALPKEENFQVWNITPEGLLITFDEYQVAPYAAGPQTVMVPYERLKEVINPEGPLASFK